MKKTIILLDGTPKGKNRILELTKDIAWVWSIKPRKYVEDKEKIFLNGGEDLESELKEQVDYNLERNYIKETIGRLHKDSDEIKVHGDKAFDRFVLYIHNVSPDLVEWLKDEYGVFTVNVSPLEDGKTLYDTVLEEEMSPIQVNRLIEVFGG